MKAGADPAIDRFCDSLWLEDGLARNTLESYRSDIEHFARWLDSRRMGTLLEADKAQVLGYLAHRVSQGARARTSARLLSAEAGPEARKASFGEDTVRRASLCSPPYGSGR